MKKLLLSLCAPLLAGACLADTAVEPAEELRQRLDAITSMQGDFSQILIDSDGTLLEESQGVFAMERPGKFHWHTAEPFEQLLISDGKLVWLYDPDLEQVTVREADEQLQQTPAVLISGDLVDIKNNFDVVRLSEANQLFMLYPQNDEGLFDHLTLVFAGEQLTEIRVRDGLGQLTRFQLQNVKRNRPVDQALFHFEAPEGTDVLID